MVEIEEGEDVRVIATPDLRLVFRWIGDRWTHEIQIGPGPWNRLATAVEWSTAADDPARVVSPTYQELHFQADGESALALLVGRAGPHFFSASIRVSHRVLEAGEGGNPERIYPESRVEFDLADRCRDEVRAFECNYVVHEPPVITFLGDYHSRDWQESLGWETRTPNNYDVSVAGSPEGDPTTLIAVSDRDRSGNWRVRIAPRKLDSGGTNRIGYTWSHTRVLKRGPL